MDVLAVDRKYSSLGVRDLLEARDLYHWHLTHLRNVVGTAVGLYYLRNKGTPKTRPRTFHNSSVREDSWPCVLVLVDDWVLAEQIGLGDDQVSPSDWIPDRLYLPDGRTVPVCVVKVDRETPSRDLLPRWTWPKAVVGGGFPLISRTQGQDNVASVGALVTDGHTTYALTNRHVAGPKGHRVATILNGKRVEIGSSADRQVIRREFSEVYADFRVRRSYLTLDAGLIEIDDLDQWTSQIYGLARVGELADLSELNIGTKLINAPVRAYGAASGILRGRIAALFYRHRSIGGYDDVTDFLIAPEARTRGSQPGDSGTVWHLVESDRQGSTGLRPLALQWGGQRFSGGSGPANFNFALASGLTNVLRLLDVELVVDHNTGAQPFWGKTGHYSVSTLACDAVQTETLRDLMLGNVDRVSFPASELDPDVIDDATIAAKKNRGFMPLADVPDLIWKNLPSVVPGGRDTGSRSGPEHPTHFADIDEPGADGKTLRQLCVADPTQVTVEAWQKFYDDLGHHASDERGLLPFRVWQFFDAMVKAVAAGDADSYVGAAGLLAHYVGDACQPLHGSMFADGLNDDARTGRGVHTAYETAMVDHRATEIVAGVTERLASADPPELVTSGQEAAVALVQLMDRTATRVPPKDLVLAYAATQVGVTTSNPTKNQTVTTALWNKFGSGTLDNLADGAATLAMLWDSAWVVGKGEETIPESERVPRSTTKLQKLYEDTTFVESLDLDAIGAVLTGQE